MTDRKTLAALIECVEQATGRDESLDATVGRARGLPIESWHNGRWYEKDNNAVSHPLPAYTGSLDAALTLVPEGWHWAVSGTVNNHARIAPPTGSLKTFVGYWREAKTAPRALIAACLKARMEAQPSSDT